MTTGDPLVGTAIRQYEIVARLGGGGMGVVYAARDSRLGRRVALKFLPPQWSHDQDAKQRFIREAQAASATDHPNICTIHDIGDAADGRLFIVMAQYDGQTLKQRLETGALPAEEAIEIAAQVAEGLARAHAQGVVHRDIKPGNLMLTEDGVRILDFGLAKFADARLQLTQEGSTIGTVAYMSPEQTRGDEADARSDVWAVGAVLYEMLSGRPPFRGGYPEAIAHAIKTETPASLRAAGLDVAEAVEQLVFRALHKNPAVRFQGARDLARALRQLQGRTLPLDLRTEPLAVPQAAGVAPPPRPRRWARRWAAAAVLAAILVGAPAFVFVPVSPMPVAVAPFANDTGLPELDAYRMAFTEELASQLAAARSVRAVGYDRVLELLRPFRSGTADVSSRTALQAIADSSGAEAVLMPALTYEDNRLRAIVRMRDTATNQDAVIFETEGEATALPATTAYRLLPLLAAAIDAHFTGQGPLRGSLAASVLGVLGRGPGAPASRFETADAAAAFEQGLDAYEQLEFTAAKDAFTRAAELDARHPLPVAWRSRIALLMRQDKEATEAADRAAQLPSDRLTAVERLFVQAVTAEAHRQPDRARAAYEALSARDPADPVWVMELAGFEDRQGQTDASAAAYLRVAALGDRARAHVELCRLYARASKPELARPEGQEALAAYARLGNRSGEAQARWCLADVLRDGAEQDVRLARQHADAGLRIMQELGFPYGLARAHNYVAQVALRGDRDGRAAAVAFEQALAGARATGNMVLEPRTLMNLGVAHEMFGSYAPAVDYYGQSYQLFAMLGSQQDAGQAQVNAAYLRIEAGLDPERGLLDARNALRVFEQIEDRPFEVHTRRVIARQLRFAGDHDEAARELLRALATARQHDLANYAVAVTLDLARVDADRGTYTQAIARLDEIEGTAEGLERIHAQIERGRVLTRLGAFAQAGVTLASAAASATAAQDLGSLALLRFAEGELAYEAGQLADAQGKFDAAIALVPEGLSARGVSEERAYVGLIDALAGRMGPGRNGVAASLADAAAMRRVSLDARCRIFLARIDVTARRFADVERTLAPIAAAAPIAPDLLAQVHYWRSVALRGLGRRGEADAELAAATRLVERLRAQVPAAFAAGLLNRRDIAVIVTSSLVPEGTQGR